MPYPFIQARHYTKADRKAIDLIVFHTMEAPEKGETAENVAKWFAGPTSNKASAHYCIDDNSIVQCVRDQDVAWHAPGANHDGLGFEHAGTARQSTAEWNDAYTKAMLDRSAQLAAEKCRQYKIPAVWLSVADLKAGKRGITSHVNCSKAFGGDHTDPGPGFKPEQYIALVKKYLGAAPEQAAATKSYPELRQGASGWAVTRVQKLLAACGVSPGAIDGLFGPNTAKALKTYQQQVGLPANGIANAAVWQSLESNVTARAVAGKVH